MGLDRRGRAVGEKPQPAVHSAALAAVTAKAPPRPDKGGFATLAKKAAPTPTEKQVSKVATMLAGSAKT